jgi:hypothetical protein
MRHRSSALLMPEMRAQSPAQKLFNFYPLSRHRGSEAARNPSPCGIIAVARKRSGQSACARAAFGEYAQCASLPANVPRVIELLAFPSVQLLDVAGPLQVLATANEFAGDERGWSKRPRIACSSIGFATGRGVCIGWHRFLSALASAGVLNGRLVTTH